MADKAVVTQSTLDAIGQAIIAKGGATAPITPAQMPAAITAIPSGGGGGSAGLNDVNFYLPDGTIAKSYTAAEFADLTALPDQPALDGLTAQGWNWTLADAKTYVATYGKLDIGGMYVTDNGETRLYLTIAESHLLEQPLRFGRDGGTGITVDWGDGSTPVTYNHTTQTIVKHTYPGSGDYVIRVSPVGSANLLLEGSSSENIFGSTAQSSSNPARAYSSRLKNVEIGSSVTGIGARAFAYCYSLSSVTIPSSVTNIGDYAFAYCYSLSSMTIPPSVTSIRTYTFNYCYSLSSVTIPPSVTSIANYAFVNCYSLSSMTIPPSVAFIWTYVFQSCYSLSSVTIPSSVTSIKGNTFQHCYSLLSMTIPPSVTSIDNNAFQNCYGIVMYDFTEHAQVPTLSNVNAFGSITTNCKIVVPDTLYDTWVTATNWSSANIVGHIVKASEYVEA